MSETMAWIGFVVWAGVFFMAVRFLVKNRKGSRK